MNKSKRIIQLVYGVLLVVFGTNGAWHFIPLPAPSPEGGVFMGALASTKVLFPLIAFTEVVAGVLLVLRKASAFALVILFPILLGAVIFHATLDPGGIMMALIFFMINLFLMVMNKDKYQALIN